MGQKFAWKNEIYYDLCALCTSCFFKRKDLGHQTLKLYKNDMYSYDGKKSLEEEFVEDSENIFNEFDKLRRLQENYKKKK